MVKCIDIHSSRILSGHHSRKDHGDTNPKQVYAIVKLAWSMSFQRFSRLLMELQKGKSKEKSIVTNNTSNKNKSGIKPWVIESQIKSSKIQPPKDEDDTLDEKEDDGHGDTLCGACSENYASDEFCICCDLCEKWFHGKCVNITPARDEHIKHYKCRAYNNKRHQV